MNVYILNAQQVKRYSPVEAFPGIGVHLNLHLSPWSNYLRNSFPSNKKKSVYIIMIKKQLKSQNLQ